MGERTGDGRLGGNLSDALLRLNQPILRKLRTALVAGQIGAAQLSGLNCIICDAQVIRSLCSGNPLADNLTSQGWPSIFGQTANDAIVHVSSQLTGLPSFQGITRTALHSAGMKVLDFGGPIELEEASGIPADVINLLNKPITAIDFIPLPP